MQQQKWLRENVLRLTTLNPDEPLDDLEFLRDFVGDARVVALGEGAHFIEEFWSIRQRLLRFLCERLGFTLIAAEFDLHEAIGLDGWLTNSSDTRSLIDVSPYAANWGMSSTMFWLRSWRERLGRKVHFEGLDIPNGGEAFATIFRSLSQYITEVDPDSAPILKHIEPIVLAIAGSSVAKSAHAWATLGEARQDALTAGLARLQKRMHALKFLYLKGSSSFSFTTACHQIEALVCADYAFRSNEAMQRGVGALLDLSIRDKFMADSLMELYNSSEARIVLLAHNGHIQKQPIRWGDYLSAYPMGFYLDALLGNNYRVIGTSTTDKHTSELEFNWDSKVGFKVIDTPLEAPKEGSLESALLTMGLGNYPTFTMLSDVQKSGVSFDRIRAQSGYLMGDMGKAYDGILVLPSITLQQNLGF